MSREENHAFMEIVSRNPKKLNLLIRENLCELLEYFDTKIEVYEKKLLIHFPKGMFIKGSISFFTEFDENKKIYPVKEVRAYRSMLRNHAGAIDIMDQFVDWKKELEKAMGM